MTRFEDNLWREMERAYGPELSGAEGPLQRRSRLRRRAIGGTGLGVLGVSAAAVFVLSAANSSPAFAVTSHADGSVSVVIRRLDGVTGANLRLAQLGVRARAVQVADACQARAAAALPPVAIAKLVRARGTQWVSSANGAMRATIQPKQIPSGQTLIIPAVRVGKLVRLVPGRAVRGAVPECLPPAIQVQTGPTTASMKVWTCRPGMVPRQRVLVPNQATNTTSSHVAAAPSTGTQTASGPPTTTPGTATAPTITSETGTATQPGTATEPETATQPGSGTGPVATPAPPNIVIASRVVRACLVAAQRVGR